MFPCEADLDLYTAKRLPQWALAMRDERAAKRPTSWKTVDLIDTCVNAHANVRVTKGECAAQNTMALITRMIRAGVTRRAVVARLLEIENQYEAQAKQPGRAGLGDRLRAGFARKWAKRLSDAK